jgi:hypothetical protein
MRRLLVLMALFASYACATNTLVQSNGCAVSGVTSTTCALSSTIANGDLLIVTGQWGNQTGTFTVTDNATGCTNAWNQLSISPKSDTASGGDDEFFFWAINCGPQSTLTATVAISGGGSHSLRFAIADFSSTTGWNASPLDVQNSNAVSGVGVTTGNPGSVTPSAGGELLFAVLGATTTVSSFNTSSCTELDAGGSAGTGYAGSNHVVGCYVLSTGTSATTPTFNWTSASAYAAIGAVFKPSTGDGSNLGTTRAGAYVQ